MGKRKREMAAAIKESRKSVFVAKGSYPSSPRKMRLVVDLIRGKSVEEALYILKFSKQEASEKLEKLVLCNKQFRAKDRRASRGVWSVYQRDYVWRWSHAKALQTSTSRKSSSY